MKKSPHPFFWVFLGLILNLIESFWFGRDTIQGFNWTPQSIPEVLADFICIGLILFGMIEMFREQNRLKRESQKRLAVITLPCDFKDRTKEEQREYLTKMIGRFAAVVDNKEDLS